jgi:E3 ubiquitin-protein ligase RNF14
MIASNAAQGTATSGSFLRIKLKKKSTLDLNETYESSSSSDHEADKLIPSCPVCYEELLEDLEQGEPTSSSSSVRLETCQHVFCRPCLQDYCTFTITSSRRIPIQCPMTIPLCETSLSHDQVRDALVPEQEAAYHIYVRLERLSRDSSLAPCPLCDELAGPFDILQDDSLMNVSSSSILACEDAVEGSLDSIEVTMDDKVIVSQGKPHEQQRPQTDLNCRYCLNADCPQTVFCAIHGSGHLTQTCVDYMAAVSEIAGNKSIDNDTTPEQQALQFTETLHILSQFSKPCPHCGAAICKSAGCDHVVCPMCQNDFCFKCGTHEFLTSKNNNNDQDSTDPPNSMFRSCSQCQQSFLDHRYMTQF